jgi:hypothetical protein
MSPTQQPVAQFVGLHPVLRIADQARSAGAALLPVDPALRRRRRDDALIADAAARAVGRAARSRYLTRARVRASVRDADLIEPAGGAPFALLSARRRVVPGHALTLGVAAAPAVRRPARRGALALPAPRALHAADLRRAARRALRPCGPARRRLVAGETLVAHAAPGAVRGAALSRSAAPRRDVTDPPVRRAVGALSATRAASGGIRTAETPPASLVDAATAETRRRATCGIVASANARGRADAEAVGNAVRAAAADGSTGTYVLARSTDAARVAAAVGTGRGTARRDGCPAVAQRLGLEARPPATRCEDDEQERGDDSETKKAYERRRAHST